MPTIKAIVFDAYGTLFDIASIDDRLRDHFGEQAMAVGTTWRHKQLEYTWLRTLMGRYIDFYDLTGDALDFACALHQVAYDDKIRRDLMSRYYKLSVYPEVRPALEVLAADYQLAILSNANPSLLERAVNHNDIESLISFIFSVDGLQLYKPSPAVYELPVKGLGLDSSQILFVSSNTWDVAGAASFGLRVAWIRRRVGEPEKLGFLPDLIVNDLTGLAGLIPTLK